MHMRMHILTHILRTHPFKQLHRIIPVFSVEGYPAHASKGKDIKTPKQFKSCVDFSSAFLGHPGKAKEEVERIQSTLLGYPARGLEERQEQEQLIQCISLYLGVKNCIFPKHKN